MPKGRKNSRQAVSCQGYSGYELADLRSCPTVGIFTLRQLCERDIAMVSRRQFCKAATTSVIAASVAPRALANTALESAIHIPSPKAAATLDMAAAQLILSEQSPLLQRRDSSGAALDLGKYSDYTQVALQHLVDRVGRVDVAHLWAGFRYLTQDGALTLTTLPLDYCCLIDLVRLDEQAASIIGNWDRTYRPMFYLVAQEPLSESVASNFISGLTSGSLVPDISHAPTVTLSLPSVSAEVARALRLHDHMLDLCIRDEPLSPSAARELALHAGWHLTLEIAKTMPYKSILALTSNPDKIISTELLKGKCRVTLRTRDDHWVQ